jgi:hypothetical protein
MSLKESHSFKSNFKLTIICFFASLAVSLIWIGLAILKTYPTYSYIMLGIGGVLFILTYILISHFTRI